MKKLIIALALCLVLVGLMAAPVMAAAQNGGLTKIGFITEPKK